MTFSIKNLIANGVNIPIPALVNVGDYHDIKKSELWSWYCTSLLLRKLIYDHRQWYFIQTSLMLLLVTEILNLCVWMACHNLIWLGK